MATNKVEGLSNVVGNLNRRIKGIKRGSRRGLRNAGFWVEAESKRLAPVDTGNLRASGYSRVSPGNVNFVEIGFAAAYAVFVHENVDQVLKGKPRRSGTQKGRYWESGEPKFLEKPLRNTTKIRNFIIDEGKVR